MLFLALNSLEVGDVPRLGVDRKSDSVSAKKYREKTFLGPEPRLWTTPRTCRPTSVAQLPTTQ